jgi:hypothetical protein
MNITVDKKDLISLVNGSEPSLERMYEFEKFGDYSASYDSWNWNWYKLEELSNEQLWNLYLDVKNIK